MRQEGGQEVTLRTLRGVAISGQPRRLVLDDGRYEHGYKVKSFIVWSPTFTNPGFGVLSYTETIPIQANAANNEQFGWCNYDVGTTNLGNIQAVIDPDHVIQQDAYIHAVGASLSYLVILEPITMSGPQAVLQLVKGKSQA